MKKLLFTLVLLISSIFINSQITPKDREQIKKELKEELRQENILNRELKINQLQDILGSRIKLNIKGLLRVAEQDWNSESARGVYRDDQFWSRMNFYAQLDAKIAKNISATARIRTGNQQYSFVTFGGNSEDRLSIMLDKLYLKYDNEQYWVTLGRNSVIWKNQQGVQFDVPTHDGIATGAKYKIGKNINLKPSLAFYIERYSGGGIETNGRMYGGEIVTTHDNEATKITGNLGLIISNNLQRDTDDENAGRYINTATGGYYDGDLADDYSILSLGADVSIKKLKNLTFAADFYHNMKNYDKNPISYQIKTSTDGTFTPDFTDEKTGYIITISVGNRGNKGDWKASASYLYMEKYAAQDYFAQWDYSRFAATNIKGPELFVTYQPFKNIEFGSRFFLINEIKGYHGDDPDFKQNGNRIRFDINFKF